MTSHSDDFEAFAKSVHAPITDRASAESLDLQSLHQLEGDELRAAEDLLIERLGESEDSRVPMALREIDSQRAVDPLRARLASARQPPMRLAVAEALWRIAKDAAAVGPVLEVLAHGQARDDRAHAARVAREVGGDEAERALAEALRDPEPAVRLHALDALLARRKLTGMARTLTQPLGLIKLQIQSSLPSVGMRAADEMGAILAKLHGGATPQAIGLDRRVEWAAPLLESLNEERGEVDLSPLASRGDAEREWAEEVLLIYLPKSPRAARALGAIGGARAAQALAELAPRAEGVLAERCADALRRLAERGHRPA